LIGLRPPFAEPAKAQSLGSICGAGVAAVSTVGSDLASEFQEPRPLTSAAHAGLAATISHAMPPGVWGKAFGMGDTLHAHQKSSEPPPPDPLFLLGLAVLPWLLIALAGVALWPEKRDTPLISRPPSADQASEAGITEPAQPPYIGIAGSRPQAKRAVRLPTKVKVRRPRGPSIAARVFAVTTY